jgi:hypothetical protein
VTATIVGDRPRSVAEIVDAAIQLIRHHYLSLVTVTAIGYVPYTVVQMTVFRRVVAAAGAGAILQSSPSVMAVYYAFTLLWSALIDLTLTVAVSDAYLGRSIEVAAVFNRALPRATPTVVATILKYALIGVWGAVCLWPFVVPTLASSRIFLVALVGVCMFIAGGCYLVGLLFATTAAVVLENAGPLAALRRSAQLSKGRIGHVVGALTLAYGIYFLGLFPIVLLAARGDRTLAHFLSVGATILLFPIVSTTRVLLYYDARIRTEGYDLELMAQRLGAAGASLPSS